jgi:hypothetical protein
MRIGVLLIIEKGILFGIRKEFILEILFEIKMIMENRIGVRIRIEIMIMLLMIMENRRF